jgi:hypothetical protein
MNAMKPDRKLRPSLSALSAAVVAAATLSFTAGQAGAKDIDGDGIPNRIDQDVDNDGIQNRNDRNVDGGVCKRGPKTGKYVGDRLPNGSRNEKDIDDDGLADDAPKEKDIDGDGEPDTRDDDIDGDGRPNRLDDDCDGDSRGRGRDGDDDGDDTKDNSDVDDDNDGIEDDDDTGEVELGLERSKEAPVGSRVRVKIRKLPSGEVEFEVDGRNLAKGDYDIVVAGKRLGALNMVEADGRTEGETEFETTPNDSDELALPFDPSGQAVEIKQAGRVFFSGMVPTPIV